VTAPALTEISVSASQQSKASAARLLTGQALSFLLVFGVKQFLLELADVVMDMREADDPIDGPADITATRIADDHGAGGGLQAIRLGFQPVMIFDGGLDPAIRGDFDPHAGQGFSRVAQEIQIFGRRTFPEMKIKRLVLDDFRAR
jgi:hypothetical protein